MLQEDVIAKYLRCLIINTWVKYEVKGEYEIALH